MILKYDTIDLLGKSLFTLVNVKTPMQVPANMPADEACFVYVLEGENITYSESVALKINTNQAMLSKCGNYVAKMFSKKKEGVFSSITVHFHKEVLEKVYENQAPPFLKKDKPSIHPNAMTVAANKMIRKYFEGILYFFEQPKLINEELLILKLKEVILLLLQTNDNPQIKEMMSYLFSKRVFEFKEIIQAHLYTSITIKELAQLTNRSLSSFKKEFFKVYQDTPSHYIIERRLEKIADSLVLTDDSISSITYDCGFKSLSHLSRIFKKKYGMTPSQFRQNQLSKK